jgi:High potential iron-sulfur protein
VSRPRQPQAVALGYKADNTKVDKAKYPQHAATQVCNGCNFYQGKAADAMAPCQLFAGKQVAAKGWCSGWVKKAT